MTDLKTYQTPETDIIVLQGRDHILELSNYGTPGQPGSGFEGGNTIDNPIFF